MPMAEISSVSTLRKAEMGEARLLSPEKAAAYLGLGSRWSIYRLISAGELRAVRLLGKIRLDRADLDELIERKKHETVAGRGGDVGAASSPPVIPRARLRPMESIGRKRPERRRVTAPVTAATGSAQAMESRLLSASEIRTSQCLSDARPRLDSRRNRRDNGTAAISTDQRTP